MQCANNLNDRTPEAEWQVTTAASPLALIPGSPRSPHRSPLISLPKGPPLLYDCLSSPLLFLLFSSSEASLFLTFLHTNACRWGSRFSRSSASPVTPLRIDFAPHSFQNPITTRLYRGRKQQNSQSLRHTPRRNISDKNIILVTIHSRPITTLFNSTNLRPNKMYSKLSLTLTAALAVAAQAERLLVPRASGIFPSGVSPGGPAVPSGEPAAPFPTGGAGAGAGAAAPSGSGAAAGTGIEGGPAGPQPTEDTTITYTIGSGTSTTVITTTIHHTRTSTEVSHLQARPSRQTVRILTWCLVRPPTDWPARVRQQQLARRPIRRRWRRRSHNHHPPHSY